MRLQDADNILAGTTAAARVYAGNNLIYISDAELSLLNPARENSQISETNFSATWTLTPTSKRYREVRVNASGARVKDNLINLLHKNDDNFDLGTYLITFDVEQHSGVSINDFISNTRDRVQIISRDNDNTPETPDSLNKDRFGVFEGKNYIITTIFDDGTTNKEPAITLFFKRNAIFDITISNLELKILN